MCLLYVAVDRHTADAGFALAPCRERSTMQLHQLRLHHAQVAVDFCGGNISETARLLGMHRRTLQRILRRA